MLTIIEKAVSRPLGLASSMTILAISLIVTSDVVMRGFGTSLAGAPEIAENLLVVFVFLTLAYTQAMEGNVSIEFLVRRLPLPLQQAASIVSKIVCLAVTLVFVVGTSREAIKSWSISEYKISSFDIPLWPSKFIVTLGFLFLALILAVQLVREIGGERVRSDGSGSAI